MFGIGVIFPDVKTRECRGRPRCIRCGGFVDGWEGRVEENSDQSEPACSCDDRYRRSDWIDVTCPPDVDLFVWDEETEV